MERPDGGVLAGFVKNLSADGGEWPAWDRTCAHRERTRFHGRVLCPSSNLVFTLAHHGFVQRQHWILGKGEAVALTVAEDGRLMFLRSLRDRGVPAWQRLQALEW